MFALETLNPLRRSGAMLRAPQHDEETPTATPERGFSEFGT